MAFVSMDFKGRPAVVVGGGAVAERRIQSLLLEEAHIAVIAPEVTAMIAELAQKGAILWRQEAYSQCVLMDLVMHELMDTTVTGAMPRTVSMPLVFVATNDSALNERIMVDAHRLGGLVNRADDAGAGDFTMPNVIRLQNQPEASVSEVVVPFQQSQDTPLSKARIAIAIEMTPPHPRLSRLLRRDMENRYAGLEVALSELVAMRRQVRQQLATSQERQEFWHRHLGGTEFTLIRQGQWDRVKETLENAISALRVKP